MTLGAKLLKLRLENRYSQSYVATFVGLDQSTYCRMESDKAQLKFQTALKIAQFYKISLDELYAGINAVSVF